MNNTSLHHILYEKYSKNASSMYYCSRINQLLLNKTSRYNLLYKEMVMSLGFQEFITKISKKILYGLLKQIIYKHQILTFFPRFLDEVIYAIMKENFSQKQQFIFKNNKNNNNSTKNETFFNDENMKIINQTPNGKKSSSNNSAVKDMMKLIIEIEKNRPKEKPKKVQKTENLQRSTKKKKSMPNLEINNENMNLNNIQVKHVKTTTHLESTLIKVHYFKPTSSFLTKMKEKKEIIKKAKSKVFINLTNKIFLSPNPGKNTRKILSPTNNHTTLNFFYFPTNNQKVNYFKPVKKDNENRIKNKKKIKPLSLIQTQSTKKINISRNSVFNKVLSTTNCSPKSYLPRIKI